MSQYVGARTHASKVRAQHASRIAAGNASRLAAAGLVLFLTFGQGASAQAGEGSTAGGRGPAESDTSESADSESGHGRGAARGRTEGVDVRSDDTPERAQGAGDDVEISGTSSDTDMVTLVVVAADGRTTTTRSSSQAAGGAATVPSQVRRVAAVAATGKTADKLTDKDTGKSADKGADKDTDKSADKGADKGADLGADDNEGTSPQPAGPAGTGHDPVTICHNGHEIVIDDDGLNGHSGHDGDELCVTTDDETGGAEESVTVEDSTGREPVVEEVTPEPALDEEVTPEPALDDEVTPEDVAPEQADREDVDLEEVAVVSRPDEDRAADAGPDATEPEADLPGRPAGEQPVDEVKGTEAERKGGPKHGSPTVGAVPEQTSGPAATGEVLGVSAQVSPRNRPAALVLPQTGVAEGLGLQAGAGLALVLAGAMTLRGRRRSQN